MPYLEKGAIRGVSLGDEPCCGGLPVSDLAAVADFVKDMIEHTKAFVYVNECGRTFMGIYNNGTDGMQVLWSILLPNLRPTIIT
jgi:hypothetical protein